jgi:hypothetical protein
MNILIRYCLLLAFLTSAACAQPKGVNGVYAGVQLMPSTMPGGGMSRIDVVILFRPNGTYNDDLSKPDWQTRVTGRYTVNGRTVSLREPGDKEATTYTLTKSGDMDAGSFNLIRQPLDNSVPKGYFEFTSASGSGGGVSGMVYVGSSSNTGLYFDGKGGFSNNSQSATVVSGNGIGGGGSRNSNGQGTYTINKGVLTLKFNDGKTQVHSFFCRPGYDPVMAAIDGDIYFMKDPKKIAKTSTGTSGKSAGKTRSNTNGADANTAGNATDAKTLLLKANAVHGGSTLDGIKTVKFTATAQGLQASGFVDVSGERVRLEMHQNGKLLQVEQTEGQTGWQWRAGSTSSLTRARIAEMSSSFYSGILGLRKSAISTAVIKGMKSSAAGTVVVYEHNGQTHAFMISGNGRLTGGADQTGQTTTTSTYSNFQTVNGVLVPFHELNTTGNQRVAIQYQSFEINPSLPESTWGKP